MFELKTEDTNRLIKFLLDSLNKKTEDDEMHYKWYREADEKIKQLENEKNELSQKVESLENQLKLNREAFE